jgi:hypothetical protein
MELPSIRVRRKDAARMLLCSISSLKRKQKAGLLTPLKDCAGGAVYYPIDQVVALASQREQAND